jgi:uroporphyrinogen-III decarboxylase
MNTMTGEERILGAVKHQKTDRTPCAISNMNYFIARHYKVKIADYIADPVLSKELSVKMFNELGGYDMAPQMMPPASYKGPFGMESMSLFNPQKMLFPGKDLPPDSIPQAKETELIKPEDYSLIIDQGWIKYAREYIIPQLGSGLFGQPSQPKKDATDTTGVPQSDIASSPTKGENNNSFAGTMTLTDYSQARIMGPFDVLSAARSMDKFLVDLYRYPEIIIAVMDVMVEEMIDMLKIEYQNKTLKPGLMLWAGRASSGFISPKQFEKFELPYKLKILNFCAAYDPLIQLHFDQSWTKFLPYFRDFPDGRYILELDGMTDMFKAKEILGDKMCLMGDIPATLFKFGTPADIENYCRKLIDVVGKGGGFILSSGCDVPDDARYENVKAMVDTAKNYRT